MGGLLILVLFGAYVWLAYKLTLRAKKIFMKAVLVLVALLIPTADAVYGRVKLEQMCEAEGGLRILRTVSKVEGLYGGDSIPEDEWITREGYKFVEGRLLNGKNVRKERQENGSLVQFNDVSLKSKFGFGFTNGDHATTLGRTELYIYALDTKEKLATVTNITFRGGWVERLVAGIYAGKPNSEGCKLKDFGSISWVKSVLKNDMSEK